MCLILLAYRHHPDFPLILAANRDEYYHRPTRGPHFWEEHPTLFAGRDLQAGGTWMGLTRQGRFAALTNFRQGIPSPSNRPSRGKLCTQFLTAPIGIDAYLQQLRERAGAYAGFNLLLGDFSDPQRPQLGYFSNRAANAATAQLPGGIHGLSNGLMDDPWPKVAAGKQALASAAEGELTDIQAILSSREMADEARLPDTGIDIALEKKLSSRFIAIDNYGTRSSSVLRISNDGNVEWLEQAFLEGGEPGEQQLFTFSIT